MKKGILILVYLFTINLNAQIDATLTTQIDDIIFELDSLTQVPPLDSNMILDCLVGYIAIDSASKTLTTEDIKNFYQRTTLDSIKTVLRYRFAVADYDPSLYRSYIRQTSLDSLDTGYLTWPAISFYGSEYSTYSRIDSIGRDYVLLCLTDYILKVKIEQVVEGIDSSLSEPYPWTNVSCTVLEILKGQNLPGNCDLQYPNIKNIDRNKSINRIATELDECLRFGYAQYEPTGHGFTKELIGGYGTSYNGLSRNTFIKKVEVDSIYYVFLEHLAYDNDNDMLVPSHQHESKGGLIPLIDGKIEDPNDIFGLGTNPTELNFKNRINTLIDHIDSWWIK